jgi:hypothetical protein
MTRNLGLIRSYLVPRPGSYWKWSTDGEAIVGPGGRTIAFRRELELVLKRQVSDGLPPLGPIVLVLAACRNSWPEICDALGGLQEPVDRLILDPDETIPFSVDHAQTLNQIHALPEDLRTKPDAKAELVAAVLERVKDRTTPELAAEIVGALEAGLAAEFLQTDATPNPTNAVLFVDVRVIEMGVQGLDADALRLRLTTGLDREVLPAEIDEPLAKKVRRLLDQLKGDQDLSGLVRLARNLMAIVHLPRPLDVPDEMPVGGVSDISQRGTLDRLLISELAQDDQTLMLRLAMNEALYLRRETPPAHPPRSRVVVVDSGLRLWGVPRVFATSVALSLAALTDATIDLSALRPEGDRLQPVDLATRQGVIDHLNVLRPEAHPARALADLKRHVAKLEGEVDTILITGDDVAQDAEFRRDLAEWNHELSFLITVSRSGELRLMQRTVHGTTLLREARLDLEKLLAPTPRPTVPLLEADRNPDLPAILRVNPFPLRLAHHVTSEQAWKPDASVVLSVTNDRRLMMWNGPACGAFQLTDRLPSRQIVWCRGANEEGRTQFVVGNPRQPRLWFVTADLQSRACQIAGLPTADSPVDCVCDHAGTLFVIHKREIDLVDIHSGNRLKSHPIPNELHWVCSRFFRGPDAWYALSYDGSAPRFECVVGYGQFADFHRLIAMFDVKGVQGPVGICSGDGSLFFTEARAYCPLKVPLQNLRRVHRISRDGRKLWVICHHRRARPKGGVAFNQTVVVDTFDQHVHFGPGDPGLALEPGLWQIARPHNLRSHFRKVGCLPGALILETLRGQYLALRYISERNSFTLSTFPQPKEVAPLLQPFMSEPAAPGVGYRLSVATFADKSRVYSDSRGLLHLRSRNRRIPEATFVMCDDDAAGWDADGRRWGKSYFVGPGHVFDAEEIYKSILLPFTRWSYGG